MEQLIKQLAFDKETTKRLTEYTRDETKDTRPTKKRKTETGYVVTQTLLQDNRHQNSGQH